MKRNIIAAFALLFAAGIQAQSSNPSFSLGAKGGINIAFFADNFSSGTSNIVGNAGAVGVMNFGKNGFTSLIGEILFNQKGGTNQSSGLNEINNIDIPILFRYSKTIKEDFPMKLFFNAGPYVGMMVSRKKSDEPQYFAKDFKSNFLELGLCAGLGGMYPIGPGSVFLEFRYGFSVTNIVPQSFERNQISSISIGYLYHLQGKSQEEKDKKVDGGFE
ncbi:MAG: porin family protein [Cytophagales bacterium]